jgi:hypothetical protein
MIGVCGTRPQVLPNLGANFTNNLSRASLDAKEVIQSTQENKVGNNCPAAQRQVHRSPVTKFLLDLFKEKVVDIRGM